MSNHWKNYFEDGSTLQDNSFDPNQDTVVTINKMSNIELSTADGKKHYLCAMLNGYDLPLRFNKTMCKAMSKLAKTPDPDKWGGLSVAIYIDHKVRDPQNGGLCSVPRVRSFAPRAQVDLTQYTNQLNACQTIDDLYKTHGSFSKAIQDNPQILGLCHQLKEKLEK